LKTRADHGPLYQRSIQWEEAGTRENPRRKARRAAPANSFCKVPYALPKAPGGVFLSSDLASAYALSASLSSGCDSCLADEAKISIKAAMAAMACVAFSQGEVCSARRPVRRRWRAWWRYLHRSKSTRQHASSLPLQSRISRPARRPWRRLELPRRFRGRNGAEGSRRDSSFRR